MRGETIQLESYTLPGPVDVKAHPGYTARECRRRNLRRKLGAESPYSRSKVEQHSKLEPDRAVRVVTPDSDRS